MAGIATASCRHIVQAVPAGHREASVPNQLGAARRRPGTFLARTAARPAHALQAAQQEPIPIGSLLDQLSSSISPEAAGSEDEESFDGRLGLALAGCAFEAYYDVEGDAHLSMTSVGGTRITFTDKDFLRRKFAGLMEVTVKSGRGLPIADWWPGAKSDPYAVINVGDSAAATRVVPQNLDPVWDETFLLFVSDPAKQRLAVRVLDADLGKADDLLGTSMRGLQDLVDGGAHDVDLQLRGPGGDAGTIRLGLRFLPFDGVLASEAAAGSMGGPVLGLPPQTILSSEWRHLQRDVLEAAADAMFDPVALVDNPETDTQAWLFWNPATRKACLAFRGTEQAKWKDILTDLTLVPASLDPEGISDASQQAWRRSDSAGQPGTPGASLEAAVAALQARRQQLRSSVVQGLRSVFLQQQQEQQGGEEGGGRPAVWVHHGFLSAYASVRAEVLHLLGVLLAGEEEAWTLYLTGHSLGGALSTLCAFDCAKRTWRDVRPPRLVHYNFGSPRVGNKAFAEEYDRLVPNTWRVVNSNDAVTLVPRMLGYCHVGHKAELGPDGQLVLTRDSSRGLAEGVEMVEVALAAAINLPDLTEQLLAKQEEAAAASGDKANAAAEVLLQSKPMLVSAAGAIAAAATVLAGSGAQQQQQQEDGQGQQGSYEQAAQQQQQQQQSGEAEAAAGRQLAGASDGVTNQLPSAAIAAKAAAVVAASAVDAAPTVQEVVSLLEEEMRAMSALLDGSALQEHLEPLYLSNLRAAVERLSEVSRASKP